MKHIYLLFGLIFSSLHAYAQLTDRKTIEFDSSTRFFQGELPSSLEFNAKIKSPPIFDKILLVQHCGSKNLRQSLAKGCKDIPAISSANYWFVKEKDEKYLYIRFGSHNYSSRGTNYSLDPMKKYSIIFISKESHFEVLEDEFLLYRNSDSEDDLKAIVNKLKDYHKSLTFVGTAFSDKKYDKFKEFVRVKFDESEFQNNLDAYKVAKNLLNLNSGRSSDHLTNPTIYGDVSNALVSKNPKIYKALGRDLGALVKRLQKLQDYTSLDWKKEVKEGKASGEENLKFLLDINDLLDIVGGIPRLRFSTIDINNQLEDLIANRNALESIESLKSSVKKHFDQDQETVKLADKKSYLSGHTFSFSFKERLKNKFSPDVGITGFGFQKDFVDAGFYAGFHYNLKHLNKNIPFRYIPNKTFWHYISLNTGIASNIEKDNERGGVIQKMSLMTGLGFRINHTFRLSSGAMWLNSIDPNPISNDKRLKCVPFIALSADFEASDLLTPFTSLFPKKVK